MWSNFYVNPWTLRCKLDRLCMKASDKNDMPGSGIGTLENNGVR